MTEEEIAAIVSGVMARDNHALALATARQILALVQPAIDAAVAAERERCASATTISSFGPHEGGVVSVEYRNGYRDGIDAAQELIEAAIRKG